MSGPGRVHLLDHPLAAEALCTLRDRGTEVTAFRAAMRVLGALLLVEATRGLAMVQRRVATPLTETDVPVLARPLPCLVSVLRAGDGLIGGMLDLLPDAPVGLIGIWRDHATLQPVEYYAKLPPDIAQRAAIVADPMLATAGTAIAAIGQLKKAGVTRLSMLAAPEGIAALGAAHPDVPLFVAAVDARLDANGYIVPGLGDAGDRLFGTDGRGA
jgi:uracil phosphoribosyltransferase